MAGRSPGIRSWHRSALAMSAGVAAVISLGGAGRSAGVGRCEPPSSVARSQSIDEPGRTVTRPPAPRATGPATDQTEDHDEVPGDARARFVACDCRSILRREEVGVPWRGEIESLRDEAKACLEVMKDIQRRMVDWIFDANRLPDEKHLRAVALEVLLIGSEEIADAVAGLQARLEGLSDRLEAPGVDLPGAIREAIAAAARSSPPGLSAITAGGIQPARAEPAPERAEVAGLLAVLLDAEPRLQAHVDRLEKIAKDGIEIWTWSQHLATRKVPEIPEGQALDAAAMDARRDALAAWLRFCCAIDAFLAGAPGHLRRTGLEAPWRQLVEAAIPSTLATTRSGMPDLRESFLDKLVDDGSIRPDRQVASIQANARKRLGRWIERMIEPVDPLGDPDLVAMRTCLLQLAALLREGRSLLVEQEPKP